MTALILNIFFGFLLFIFPSKIFPYFLKNKGCSLQELRKELSLNQRSINPIIHILQVLLFVVVSLLVFDTRQSVVDAIALLISMLFFVDGQAKKKLQWLSQKKRFGTIGIAAIFSAIAPGLSSIFAVILMGAYIIPDMKTITKFQKNLYTDIYSALDDNCENISYIESQITERRGNVKDIGYHN